MQAAVFVSVDMIRLEDTSRLEVYQRNRQRIMHIMHAPLHQYCNRLCAVTAEEYWNAHTRKGGATEDRPTRPAEVNLSSEYCEH